jgi:hypothetical protein
MVVFSAEVSGGYLKNQLKVPLKVNCVNWRSRKALSKTNAIYKKNVFNIFQIIVHIKFSLPSLALVAAAADDAFGVFWPNFGFLGCRRLSACSPSLELELLSSRISLRRRAWKLQKWYALKQKKIVKLGRHIVYILWFDEFYFTCIAFARFRSIGRGLQTSQRYSSGMLFLSRPMHTTCCHTLFG